MNKKDPNIAMIIEIVGGYLGLLGLGYIYAGFTIEGIIRLVAWPIVLVVTYFGIVGVGFSSILALFSDPSGVLSIFLAILMLVLALVWTIAVFIAPVISALMLKGKMSIWR